MFSNTTREAPKFISTATANRFGFCFGFILNWRNLKISSGVGGMQTVTASLSCNCHCRLPPPCCHIPCFLVLSRSSTSYYLHQPSTSLDAQSSLLQRNVAAFVAFRSTGSILGTDDHIHCHPPFVPHPWRPRIFAELVK